MRAAIYARVSTLDRSQCSQEAAQTRFGSTPPDEALPWQRNLAIVRHTGETIGRTTKAFARPSPVAARGEQ